MARKKPRAVKYQSLFVAGPTLKKKGMRER